MQKDRIEELDSIVFFVGDEIAYMGVVVGNGEKRDYVICAIDSCDQGEIGILSQSVCHEILDGEVDGMDELFGFTILLAVGGLFVEVAWIEVALDEEIVSVSKDILVDQMAFDHILIVSFKESLEFRFKHVVGDSRFEKPDESVLHVDRLFELDHQPAFVFGERFGGSCGFEGGFVHLE